MKNVKHVGFFKFKPECTPEEIAEVWRVMENLPKEIPGILDLTWGVNDSTEGLSEGFTHSFVMLFVDKAARDNYLPHPVHQAAVDVVAPQLEAVIVCDHECESS